MIGLSLMLLLGCPKDRTGLSATSKVTENAKEVETLLLKIDEVERRIAQIEEVTRARGKQDIMKMENIEEVRIELANLRGDVETLQFNLGSMETSTVAQASDTTYRLTWLEERADVLEATLGLSTPPPQDPSSPNPLEEAVEAGGNAAAEENITEPQNDPPPDVSEPPTIASEREKSEVAPQATATETKPEEAKSVVQTPEELLKLAEEHLMKGREEAAEAVLNRLLKEHPNSANELEVYYRLAEAAFNRGAYKEAAQRFQRVIDKNAKSQWAAWALLRQGECFEEMGQPDNAKIFYQDVINEYPKSKAAKEAKDKLK